MSDSKRNSDTHRIAEDPEKTPTSPPWESMQRDIQDLKTYCHRICDSSLAFQERIPKLEKQVRRLTLFQAWFPTVVALGALLYLVIHGSP